VGLLAGAGIYLGAAAIAQHIPILLQSSAGAAIVFAALLAFSLAEMPMMLIGLRHMARSQVTPRVLLIGLFTIFVMFAAVYASVFVLVTGEIALGLLLAALCFVRYAGGAVLK
jgi:hypothetical protein